MTLDDFTNNNIKENKKEIPQVVNVRDIMFYDHIDRELTNTQYNKANLFLSNGCIVQIDKKEFICKPIPNYNTRTYKLHCFDGGRWRCNCQFFRKFEKQGEFVMCSHLLALKLFFDFKGGW